MAEVIRPWQLPLFPSSIAASVFYLVLFLGLLSEVIGVSVIPRIRRHGIRIKREHASGGSSLLLYASLFVSIYLTFIFAAYGIAMLPSWFFYPGIVLIILGILIRQWAIAILGPFFSVEIDIQEGQKVVDKGPYRLVRHPSYTGVLLILVGIGLALQSWGAILMVLMIFGLTYSYRIYVEEKGLGLWTRR